MVLGIEATGEANVMFFAASDQLLYFAEVNCFRIFINMSTVIEVIVDSSPEETMPSTLDAHLIMKPPDFYLLTLWSGATNSAATLIKWGAGVRGPASHS